MGVCIDFKTQLGAIKAPWLPPLVKELLRMWRNCRLRALAIHCLDKDACSFLSQYSALKWTLHAACLHLNLRYEFKHRRKYNCVFWIYDYDPKPRKPASQGQAVALALKENRHWFSARWSQAYKYQAIWNKGLKRLISKLLSLHFWIYCLLNVTHGRFS